ncbi:hypothetical protein [Nostoc sp.]|uniref:hypothetical protein n=1 Tax=Nostoc sp. TaxID=1180 RepID=UPI002FF4410E
MFKEKNFHRYDLLVVFCFVATTTIDDINIVLCETQTEGVKLQMRSLGIGRDDPMEH